VRSWLNNRIIGHTREKEAILLALVAREHVYIEGPPGVAKTMLAESAAEATGLSFFFYQMHRDTKLHELIGDAVIVREPHPDGGEIVRSFTRPGGILTSELCVLDDISRAPGEALNVLLRLLNERQYSGPSSNGETLNLPLRTAIATSNPSDPGSRYYTEPLDPANLDRFVLQLRTEGCISAGRWDEAERIINLFSEEPSRSEEARTEAASDMEALRVATEAHKKTSVPLAVRRLVMEVLQELVERHGVTQKNSLLTDRTFLVKMLRVMRARAVLEGRLQCVPEDLTVLSYLTTFRVPEAVHRNIEEIVEKIIKKSC
jgi:MoxR-like ATPase